MRAEVTEYYGPLRSSRTAGHNNAVHPWQVLRDLRQAARGAEQPVLRGRFDAGPVMTPRPRPELPTGQVRVIVSRSMAVEPPSPIEQRQARAPGTGCQAGNRPAREAITHLASSGRVDDPKPTLMRFGYAATVLREQPDAWAARIGSLPRQTPEADRAGERKKQLLAPGFPV